MQRLEDRYRVRFDEADADGWLRPSGLLRFAQDMAWRHSEEAGFDRRWYDERDMSWLVRNVQLDIRGWHMGRGLATYGDVLLISTEVVGSRQVWVRRRSEMVRVAASDGPTERDLLAVVETDWVLLTLAGRPARVPPEIARYFAPTRPFTRDRISLPEPSTPVSRLATRVRPLDVDPMRHMNNAAYLDMVDDALGRLPQGTGISRPDCYRVGYTAPALPGTAIEIASWPVSERAVACRIADADGHELTRAMARLTERRQS